MRSAFSTALFQEKADRDEVELCPGPETPRPPDHPPPEPVDPEIDNIVIIDDEEDPLSLPPTHPPPLTPAPPPINHPLMNDPLQSNYPEQLPIVPEHMPAMMPSVPTIVPIDRLLDSSNPNEIAVIPNEGMILTKNNNNGYILQPLVIGPDGHYHIVSADAAIGNHELMANHELMTNHELMANHELMGNHELMANHDYMGNCPQTFTMPQDNNCKVRFKNITLLLTQSGRTHLQLGRVNCECDSPSPSVIIKLRFLYPQRGSSSPVLSDDQAEAHLPRKAF
ncbi:formin-like protein 2 [Ostrinia furnacalis]|uniref:formin-like protein 2 n=1 Tax=Ostrinia furnacalis TaxID=93504 RepID=UPI001038A088|nr:formin-like protein 2 [Ostrinia furnacalis]